MRAVLDPNVLVSALLSPRGAPAELVRAWHAGSFDVVVSPRLLEELEQTLTYPKLRKHISVSEAAQFVAWLRTAAELVTDPQEPPTGRSRDPDDDYLLALAERERSALVSGDDDVLELRRQLPFYDPSAFMRLLDEQLG